MREKTGCMEAGKTKKADKEMSKEMHRDLTPHHFDPPSTA